MRLLLWLAVVAGAVEVAALAIIKVGSLASAPAGWASPDDRIRHSYLWLSPHVIWMAPAMMAVFLAVPALVVGMLGRFGKRFCGVRTAVGSMVFVCVVSLLYIYPRLYDWAVVLLAAGVAVQVARLAERHEAGFLRVVRRTTVWLAAVVAILAGAMTGVGAVRERIRIGGLSAPLAGAPNVLLLILDTVRAANSSLYGYPRETMPHLARLASDGVTFDRAIATAPWTLPSHVSMFTGRLPYEFHTNFLIPYAGEYTTLAEELRQRGYMTAGFAGNLVYCGYEAGITRGFLHYEDYGVRPIEFLLSIALGRRIAASRALHNALGDFDVFGEKDAATVTGEFLRWFDHRPSDRPFFAFLNYMDAHEPYLPPRRFETRFGTGTPRRNERNRYFLRWAARPDRADMSAAEIAAEVGAYDGTVAYVDEQVGVLLDRLRETGVLRNTLVIVVGDHGEQFGEHGLHVHGNSLFMPALHVPLVVAYEGGVPAGRRVGVPATIRDIPATVMSLIGESAAGVFPGKSLERYWQDSGQSAEPVVEPVYSELTDIRGAPTVKSLLVGRYHYIWGENRVEALFDLASDPTESTSLMTRENLDLVTRLRRLMAPHIRNDRALWQRLPQSQQGEPRPRR